MYYINVTSLSFEEFVCHVALMNSYISLYIYAHEYYLYVCVCASVLTNLILPIDCS